MNGVNEGYLESDLITGQQSRLIAAGTPENLLVQLWDHRDRYSILMLLHSTGRTPEVRMSSSLGCVDLAEARELLLNEMRPLDCLSQLTFSIGRTSHSSTLKP